MIHITILNINGVKIKWLGHASFKFEYDDKVIYIDPYQIDDPKKADIILITHGHYDHCSMIDIKNLTKKDTLIITTPDTTSKLARAIKDGKTKLVQPDEEFSYLGIRIRAIPAYNIEKDFHPKENQWVGYLLEIGNLKIYHAGDTDVTPENKQVKADIMLLPVGGTYTMDAKEAAALVNLVKPKLAIPMHYGSIVGTSEDAQEFKRLCSCPVKIL